MIVENDALPTIDSADFLKRLQGGDGRIIGHVVERYLPELLRAGFGVGLDRHEAEDVAQETFVTLVQSASKFEGGSKVRTYLFGIFYRKVQEHRRKSIKTDDIDEVMEGRFNPDGTWLKPPKPVDFELHRKDIRAQINSCLDGVPVQQRMAFILKEVEAIPADEICQIMKISHSNLGVLLFRAKNRLRECLESKLTGEA